MKPQNSPPDLLSALESLPLNERAALRLRDVEQLTLPEVAQRMGCSLRDARLHVAQGRVQLLRIGGILQAVQPNAA
jgi:DNA-directed RNA polymerase specialized sigma24 family protein